ncbi:hypothetical protein P775_10815 [Puniceibacterium antarcticum]|uniref:Uncharacterized protein n=2 Tax=Puniceibacterium antarcticum TaxID=1206336 RepID=A0A2G8RF50_9RHOB|nr:hypothetical protein P775_10815 [Puniceibacterium antarcticum]
MVVSTVLKGMKHVADFSMTAPDMAAADRFRTTGFVTGKTRSRLFANGATALLPPVVGMTVTDNAASKGFLS